MARRLSQDKPICVTGANGYIGGFIVEELLKEGYTVHGTVRDPTASKNAFLLDLAKKAPGSGGKVTLFAADLTKKDSFDKAVAGCEVVIHVAAVVAHNYKKDPFTEMINPCVDGCVNIAETCKRAGVRRIVYTSSVATICCAEKYRAAENKGKKLTEDMWNTHVTPTYGTYQYAKIKSEEKLNEVWKGELVSILPAWVIGPQQNDQITSSQQVVRALANKEYGKMVPPLWLHFVDIRDIARAHVFGATQNDVPSGRYTCVATGECQGLAEWSKAINETFPELSCATMTMPWFAMWAASWFDSRIGTFFLYEKCIKNPDLDNSRLCDVGFKYKHGILKDTLKDAIESFKEHGILKNLKK